MGALKSDEAIKAVSAVVRKTLEWRSEKINEMEKIIDSDFIEITADNPDGSVVPLKGAELEGFKIGLLAAIEILTPFPCRMILDSACEDLDGENDFAHEGAPR